MEEPALPALTTEVAVKPNWSEAPTAMAEARAWTVRVGFDHSHHLVDAVTKRMLPERALERVLPDGASFVRMRKVVRQVLLHLVQIPVGHDLFSRREEGGQLVLGVHHLARSARRQLEGARV